MEKINWQFDNSYSKLSDTFREIIKPTPVHNPEIILLNHQLAEELNLDLSKINNQQLSKIFSGNYLPKETITLAQAYAGHQFGHFTMLGDGRAVLLGEHLDNKKNRYDIQFKGSGRTSFSRGGDGRAALGPMLREYIISEAIHLFNIPTTRSLAVVKTGEKVIRESLLQGAILTRVASSHLRVGTFQYIASKQNIENLNTLIDYTINRHYPKINTSKFKAYDLLNTVIEKQCDLVVNWMRVGFIHGVMNTDNMSISGETIDYGPCAFMDSYDSKTVFSSIDKYGRYAYSNQPPITKWNLARFAECLIPMIDKNEDYAIKLATDLIENFKNIYEDKWLNMMRGKLGLFGKEKKDEKLITDLLNWMEKNKADYTNTFCHLMDIDTGDVIYQKNDFINWAKEWKKRSNLNNSYREKGIELMKKNNPIIIPRNHIVEDALKKAESGDLDKVNKLLQVLKEPFEKQKKIKEYQKPSPMGNKKYQTFCGT